MRSSKIPFRLTIFSAIFLLPPLLLEAITPATAAALTIIAPSNRAVLENDKAVIAGKVRDPRQKTVLIRVNSDQPFSLPVRKGAFSSVVKLRPGTNNVQIQCGEEEDELTLEYKIGEGIEYYRFHAGYGEGDCGECHSPTTGWVTPTRQVKLCYSCHDSMDEAKFLHGPIAAGHCTTCHDPHGSKRRVFLMAEDDTLCEQCHAQSSSREHMAAPGKDQCLSCHNPHGAAKRFFLRE